MYIDRSVRRAMDGKAAILRHIHKTGMTFAGQPVWTEDELACVRRHYPDIDRISSSLRRRSRKSISHKASQLGLVRRLIVWRPDETRQLPPPYKAGTPIAEIQQLFGSKTKQQIYSKAYGLRVRRPPRKLKPTGFPIIDLIRERAKSQGYTMADLNAWTGCGEYFRHPRYMNWLAVDRALKLLGGRVMPKWPR